MKTADLLRAWIELLCTRDDLRFTTEIELAPTEAPERYPADARAFAQSAGTVRFSYVLANDPDQLGCLFLDLTGVPADLEWMMVDGKDLPPEALKDFYELELDRLGTGQAGWYWVPDDGPAKIAYSLEQTVLFDTLDEYLRAGARRGFGFGWQWGRPGPLERISLPRTTSTEAITAALLARGAPEETARALVEWLGVDAVLLVPGEGSRRDEVQPPAAPVTFIGYRPCDLPAELRACSPLPTGIEACFFWATRGGPLPVTDQLVAAIPEPSIDGLDAGVGLMALVGRVLATATAAHVAVGANGSFSYGFHPGDAAQVEAWLHAHGVTIVPVDEILDRVLVVRALNLPTDDEWIKCTVHGNDWAMEVKAVGPGLFAFDREDSQTDRFELQRFDETGPRVEVRASDVARGAVLTIEL